MATAGGLVFHAEPDGNLQAYDAANGDLLWQYQLGFVGPSAGLRVNGGGPVATFEAGGEQYVALTMNKIVWAFKLGGAVPPRPAPPAPFTVQPWEGRIVETGTHRQDRVDDDRGADDSDRQSSRGAPRRIHVQSGARQGRARRVSHVRQYGEDRAHDRGA
jgi:outer membrane protein assembly factor BamB